MKSNPRRVARRPELGIGLFVTAGVVLVGMALSLVAGSLRYPDLAIFSVAAILVLTAVGLFWVARTHPDGRASSVLSVLTLLGFIFFSLVDFVSFPWRLFAVWLCLATAAVVSSSANLLRERRAQFAAELALNVAALVLLASPISVLLKAAG